MKAKKDFSFSLYLDNNALIFLAARVQQEMELRGLPDISFKQGYKAGFLAALRDGDFGPGQVWSDSEVKDLYKELDRRFAA